MFSQHWTLIVLATCCSGLEIIPLQETGIFKEHLHQGYIYSSNINIFVGIDIGDIYEQINLIKLHLKDLQKICKENCTIKTEIELLYTRFTKLHSLSIQLKLLTQYRQKRGLIDAIGSISKSLFGTLDADDLTTINANIDKLFDDENELKTIVANQTALIRKIVSNDSMKRLLGTTAKTQNSIHKVREEELLNTKLLLLEGSIHEAHLQIDEIFNMILLGKNGIISPQLIDHDIFITSYANTLAHRIANTMIQPKLENFQFILDIADLTLFSHDNHIFFKLAIPLLTDMEWKIVKIYPIPTKQNNAFLAPHIGDPIYLTSGLNYINVDEKYLDRCKNRHNFLICKQTTPIHDIRTVRDCSSELISIEKPIQFCKFTIFKIDEITFIPLTAENQYIAIPANPIELTIFYDKGNENVKLKQTSLLRSKVPCDILYGNNHMKIGGLIANVSYEIKIKAPILNNDTDLSALLDTLERTPKVLNDYNSYTDSLDQITDKANRLQFARRIESVKSWGLTTLQIFGYTAIAILGLFTANKLGLFNTQCSKICLNIFCCKIKKNHQSAQSNTIRNSVPPSQPPINIFTPMLTASAPEPSVRFTRGSEAEPIMIEPIRAKLPRSILKRRNLED